MNRTCRCCGKEYESAKPQHRLLAGDSRNAGDVARLFGDVKANVVVTSPPYASQRKYDESSGFKPIPPDDYVEWFRAVADIVASVLAPDGSYFLNIKEHAEDGERSLYVKDLVLAHKRAWGWRFVNEFCWRKTDNGVPGSWPNRFKNAWEPVFHFAKIVKIKFRPDNVTHASDGVMEAGTRGHADGRRFDAHGTPSVYTGEHNTRKAGMALPSNVIEVKSETGQGQHAAPFARSLVEFFIKAFSDPLDVVYDPFMGGGTTMAAAHVLNRSGYGCEISPGYCDVIILRMQKLKTVARLAGDGRTYEEIKAERLGSK